jgi:tetratricopeptide (TPR) repeat protein
MKRRPTVFISGVSGEFASFRDAVEQELQVKGCFAENQPTFAPDYRDVEAMLTARIEGADAVICLVGFRFGAEPRNRPAATPRRSYTQMEFDIARRLEKPIYRFVSDEKALPRDPAPSDEQDEDADAQRLQLEHRRAVTADSKLYYFFKNKPELRLLVARIPLVAATDFKADIFVFRHAPQRLVGRDEYLRRLDAVLTDSGVRVVTLVAWGGVGKTSLVAHWMAELARRNWELPGDGAAIERVFVERVFAWSFDTEAAGAAGGAAADEFVKAALGFFGDAEMAASAASPSDKGARIAHLATAYRTLLVLDGLERLQHPTGPPQGSIKDLAIEALLLGLAHSRKGTAEGVLCVVTTREPVAELRLFHTTTAPAWGLESLTPDAGAAVLWEAGARKAGGAVIAAHDEELKEASADVQGHALTLQLLGSYVARAHRGDIRKRGLVRFNQADERLQGGHAFKVIRAYETWFAQTGEEGARQLAILQLLGFFDRPATPDCMAALCSLPLITGLTEPLVGLGRDEWNLSVSALESAGLIKALPWEPPPVKGFSEEKAHIAMAAHARRHPFSLGEPDQVSTGRASVQPTIVFAESLDAHPLVRSYFAERLKDRNPDAWQQGHLRLYEHLKTSVPYWPEGIDGLQRLYQAVAHGCNAGRHFEAAELYRNRIGRRHGYSFFSLGAVSADLGALACFFDSPWTQLVPALPGQVKGWLLNEAAFSLRAVGRLSEAAAANASALALAQSRANWLNASVRAQNLSGLNLTLGNIADAVRDAEKAIEFATWSGSDFQVICALTTMADEQHAAGNVAKAHQLFADAEAMEVTRLGHEYMISIRGVQYCELLVKDAERAAWQVVLGNTPRFPSSGPIAPHEGSPKPQDRRLDAGVVVRSCRDVERRMSANFFRREQAGHDRADEPLLDVALDHLTRGRAMFYRALLDPDDRNRAGVVDEARCEIRIGLESTRAAAIQEYVVPALLISAWLSGFEHNPDGARAHVDEARQIAERGSMKLHMADICLHAARLFCDKDELAKARRLIEHCGYWRRKEELEDADVAACCW